MSRTTDPLAVKNITIASGSAVEPGVVLGHHVTIGYGSVILAGAQIGDGVTIGNNVIIHGGVRIGHGVQIQDAVVLGKQAKLASHSTATQSSDQLLEIEAGAAICCQSIVFCGAQIGENAIIGDQSYIRERSRIGCDSVVGRGSTVDNDVMIGDRVRIQTDIYVTAYSTIEDDVFVGPGVCMTNDSTMARHDKQYELVGPQLRRACRVGGGVTICPGIEIGEEAFIAAGAVVTKRVAPRAFMVGVPARQIREVADEELLENWR